jgi:hypothetical protein
LRLDTRQKKQSLVNREDHFFSRNGKRTNLGTLGDVRAAARAYNELPGAQPGDSNYNAVEQQMDADGAPLEYSRCT